jgi:cellulose biosynthesis protein BcsQ
VRITMLNQKGGVGAALNAAGYRVAFDDRDSQGSVTLWARRVGMMPLVGDAGVAADVVICDTPGRLDLSADATQGLLLPLIAQTDRLVVVAEKSLFSTHATVPMVELIKKHKRPDSRAYLLFNKVRTNTIVGKQSGGQLSADLGMPALETCLPLAAPFENVQTQGFGCVSGKHRELVLTLALEVLK